MDWLCLGHASWLCEAAGLRLLFDPILGAGPHGGVFEIQPRRTLVAEALRPDFILVSHRHPDHFDIPSLRRLLTLDPDAVVVTPDPLVAWACERLGARTVQQVPAGRHIHLDDVSLVTTPSIAPDEWGAVVATREGAAWNQVDSVLVDAPEVRRVADRATRELGHDGLALALVRWQPLLEVAAQLGHHAAFPYKDYATLLACAVATGARTVVPSAAGEAHAGPWTAMSQRVFPVPESRFIRDLTALSPTTRVLPGHLGGRYSVRSGAVEFTATDSPLIIPLAGPDPRRYNPLELPPVHDPGLPDVPEPTQRTDAETWIRGPLADGLATVRPESPLDLVLELRFPTTTDVYTLHVTDHGTTVTRRFTADWDAYNIVAGSMLWQIIKAQRHWGDALLSGALRGCTRAYTLADGRLQRLRIGDLFVYHGLGYDESFTRTIHHQLAHPA